jgi:hypothetical protein
MVVAEFLESRTTQFDCGMDARHPPGAIMQGLELHMGMPRSRMPSLVRWRAVIYVGLLLVSVALILLARERAASSPPAVTGTGAAPLR